MGSIARYSDFVNKNFREFLGIFREEIGLKRGNDGVIIKIEYRNVYLWDVRLLKWQIWVLTG